MALSFQQIRGYVYIVAMLFAETVGFSCAQALGGLIPPFELNFWRFLFQLIMVLLVIISHRITVFPENKHIVFLTYRCLEASWYSILIFTSVLHLPVGVQGGVQDSVMLTVTFLIGLIVWRECELPVVSAVGMCVAGIICVVQPDFIFRDMIETSSTRYHPVCVGHVEAHQNFNMTLNGTVQNTSITLIFGDKPSESVGYILTTIAAILSSITSFIINKKLTDMNPFACSFWVAAAGLSISIIGTAAFEQPSVPDSTICWLLLFGHASTASVCSIGIDIVLRIVSPVTFRMIFFTKVLIFFISQYVVMKNINRGSYNAVEVTGAVLIFIANALIPAHKLYKQWHKSKESEKTGKECEELISETD